VRFVANPHDVFDDEYIEMRTVVGRERFSLAQAGSLGATKTAPNPTTASSSGAHPAVTVTPVSEELRRDIHAAYEFLVSEGALTTVPASSHQMPRLVDFDHIKFVSNGNLGSGNFGVVDKALLDRSSSGGDPPYPVAVKRVKSGLSPENDAIEQQELRKEVVLMTQFSGANSHPNILKLIGMVVEGDGSRIMAVIQYCENGSLESFLKKSGAKQDGKFRIRVSMQVASGMDFLASRGVVHRDLAARNVLLDSSLDAQISDFGLARFSNPKLFRAMADKAESQGREYPYAVYTLSTESVLRIPVRWSAPEVFGGLRFSTLSDVWSFGMLMIEVYTNGEKPFPDLSLAQVQETVTAGGRPKKPSSCPFTVYGVMKKCWFRDPSKRPLFALIKSSLDSSLRNASQSTVVDAFGATNYERSLRTLDAQGNEMYEYATPASTAISATAVGSGATQSTGLSTSYEFPVGFHNC
jgi:serine/threonine protein kinase